MLKQLTLGGKRDLEKWAYIFNTTPEELTAKPLAENKESKQSIEWTPEDKQRLKKEWGGIFTDLFEEEEVKEDKPLKQYNYSEPIHLILENRLGFQLPIKVSLIGDYSIPIKDTTQNECDYFILIMKFKDIEQLEVGAMEFLKKAQIFNVYLIYEDNRKEKIAVPWSNDYMDMVNKYQEVTIGQDEIIIEISKTKV